MFSKAFSFRVVKSWDRVVQSYLAFIKHPWFKRQWKRSLLKTFWEREKMLTTRKILPFEPPLNCRLQTLSVWITLKKFVIW